MPRMFKAPAALMLALVALPALLSGAGPAMAAPTSVVLDARTGEVLLADNADTRQPAPALPKLMTIFLMFDAFEAGTVKPDTNLFVTTQAAAQPQPALGLREFDTIRAGDALNAVLAASANDAAAVLAEFLEGSIPRFVAAMNAKAAQLGLTQTRFTNITGAPDPKQYSSPRDMIRFALALMHTHPKRARALVGTSFAWHGRTYQAPPNILGALATPDRPGINRARGTRARDRDVIAVVWNAPDESSAERILVASLDKAAGLPARSAPRPEAAAGPGAWGLQLGAFSRRAAAQARLDAARAAMPALAAARPVIEPVTRSGRELYRAIYRGLDEAGVRNTCARLQAAGTACLPLRP